jgi:phosphopantothenoylcysteine decarboxylase
MKKNIVLGITGSVAAIKTVNLVTELSQFANLRLVITENAEYFIKSEYELLKKLDIEIFRDRDEWPELQARYQVGEPILHIEMRRWADIMVIAPLDANTLAKITYGFCDNLLTSIVRAWDWNKKLVLCPAMNTMMWDNPPTAEQVAAMVKRGAMIVEPVAKKLACNDVGIGAMAGVEDIIVLVRKMAAGL